MPRVIILLRPECINYKRLSINIASSLVDYLGDNTHTYRCAIPPANEGKASCVIGACQFIIRIYKYKPP